MLALQLITNPGERCGKISTPDAGRDQPAISRRKGTRVRTQCIDKRFATLDPGAQVAKYDRRAAVSNCLRPFERTDDRNSRIDQCCNRPRGGEKLPVRQPGVGRRLAAQRA